MRSPRPRPISFAHANAAAAAMLVAVIALASIGAAPAAAQETLLQNDGYVDGQPVGFQGGFVAGEMAGSRFTPSGTGPWRVNRVQFLFGGATSTQTITLRIYDDTAGTSAPGAQLFFGDYQVTGSNSAMQEIDLVVDNVQVPGQFRVAIEFQHSGTPSVARDGDGTINPTRNFIYSPSIPGWFQSNLFGLTGDWVIRAAVQPVAGGGPGAPDILTIGDVGNDQGRQVRIRFQRSGQDASGAATPVLHYEVLRRVDPLLATAATPAKLDGWDFVASVPAHGDNIYSVVVPTLADSTIAQGMHWSVFLVRAATAAPLTFFDSPADSGYSVDNLAPAPPSGLVYGGGLLAWNPAGEGDFDFFTVYGSPSATLGGGAVMLTRTTATDFATPGGYPYYLVTATDFAGNEGLPAVADLATAAHGPVARRELSLSASPNPFNPRTVIRFTLPAATSVRLGIYRADGRLVRTLLEDSLPQGAHEWTWDGTDGRGEAVGSGSYIARLETADAITRLPMSLVR